MWRSDQFWLDNQSVDTETERLLHGIIGSIFLSVV